MRKRRARAPLSKKRTYPTHTATRGEKASSRLAVFSIRWTARGAMLTLVAWNTLPLVAATATEDHKDADLVRARLRHRRRKQHDFHLANRGRGGWAKLVLVVTPKGWPKRRAGIKASKSCLSVAVESSVIVAQGLSPV